MNVDKLFFRSIFKNLFSDTCEIQYWDGETEIYGEGPVRFKIAFHESIPKADVVKDPSLVFGEAYMNGKMDIEGSVQEVMESIYNKQDSLINKSSSYPRIQKILPNNLKRSKSNVQHHYDLGNDFYSLWLDDTMTYSCAYFKSPDNTLFQAQKNKTEYILKKLSLNKGQTLLDIGCGWGDLIITAAKKYKVKAMGITLSAEQLYKVKERIAEEKLDDLVEVELADYRELGKRIFDRVVSVGMLEHVGKNHLTEYFSTVKKLLQDKGVSMVHSITSIKEGDVNNWIEKYIFPGGYIPAFKEIVEQLAAEDFSLLDVESLRRHYGRTLEHWARNYENALPEIRKTKDENFIRMWRLYLNSCAATFNCGNIDVHQFLFTKGINNFLPWTRENIYKD
ncbi:MAG TPA: cyclopropane-fatty-acyl-phospholipid synthase family protein [Desulfitobacteriaceae bacterium]|nr:cyclopropane-fatty-acyl-phospholipid synthase family protein [Desulfitobacteriaceae bacterium]